MQQVKAVVARAKGQPVELTTINVPDPGPGEALVQVQACGVCHTDLHYREGGINDDFPFLLGHEAAGVVEAVGPDVTGVAPGDFVILNWRAVCGECRACKRGDLQYCFNTHNATQKMTLEDGTELSPALGIGAFAEKTLVAAGQCTKVDPSARPAAVGLLGCGVMAGIGAAINTGAVTRGTSVAVIGCGGVGQAVIQGARIAGAAKIIAVDLSVEKMEMARAFGATDVINPSQEAFRQVLELTGGNGVDYAFEVVGNGKLVEQCFKSTRMNGMTVLVGVGRAEDRFSFNAMIVPFTGKTIKGCMYGSCNFKVDFPMYLDLYGQKKLDLDRLITRTYAIDEAPQAFADLESGVNARGVIVY